ncbi:hypothetical protein [Stenotrophomonas maltophilia]|nr:hypothetical protein [Stenotrophomonas maltophilia]
MAVALPCRRGAPRQPEEVTIRPLMSRHAANHGSHAERVAAHDID